MRVFLSEINPSDREHVAVFPIGTFTTKKYGKLDLSEVRAKRIIENWKQNVLNRRIRIDADHEFAEALGWIVDLCLGEYNDSRGTKRQGLIATVEWTPTGIRLLDEKAYMYLSAAIDDHVDVDGGKTYHDVLKAVSLTNDPVMPVSAVGEGDVRKLLELSEVSRVFKESCLLGCASCGTCLGESVAEAFKVDDEGNRPAEGGTHMADKPEKKEPDGSDPAADAASDDKKKDLAAPPEPEPEAGGEPDEKNESFEDLMGDLKDLCNQLANAAEAEGVKGAQAAGALAKTTVEKWSELIPKGGEQQMSDKDKEQVAEDAKLLADKELADKAERNHDKAVIAAYRAKDLQRMLGGLSFDQPTMDRVRALVLAEGETAKVALSEGVEVSVNMSDATSINEAWLTILSSAQKVHTTVDTKLDEHVNPEEKEVADGDLKLSETDQKIAVSLGLDRPGMEDALKAFTIATTKKAE